MARTPNALYVLVLWEKKCFKWCPKLVVLWPVSHNSVGKEFHSLGPVQNTSEGYMSSDDTTAQRADERRSVDDVSMPSQRLEWQLDPEAQYWWDSDESVRMMTLLDTLMHVKPVRVARIWNFLIWMVQSGFLFVASKIISLGQQVAPWVPGASLAGRLVAADC